MFVWRFGAQGMAWKMTSGCGWKVVRKWSNPEQ
jgi:hypothetical protein